MKEIKIEPIKTNYDNWFVDTQKQVDKTYQKTIDYGRTQFVNKIVELEQQLDMLKSLYQNEKEKNDTLIRIIKEVKEELKKHLNAKSYGNHKYELFSREYLVEILDLLKEIK